MKKTLRGNVRKAVLCIAFAMVIFIGTPTVSRAYVEAIGIVSANAAKVRKEPSTTSDVVAGLLKGSTVTITDEVTDSSGSLWYKVKAENLSGYIRSDLLIKGAASTGSATTASTANSTQTLQTADSSKPTPTTATPIAETKAYVNYESVRVREGASTNHEIVGSVVKNTSVVITGEAKANDGRKWYQIRYTNQSGREVVGFVRADLLTVGDPPAPVTEEPPADTQPEQAEGGEGAEGGEENADNTEEVPEEAPPEEPVPQEPLVKPDYEMVFTQNNEGVEEWYLYDNINGTRQTLAGLLAAAEAGAMQGKADTDQLSTQKIIIIVLAVVVAILVIAVTLLLFKIKDMYDEDYEDDDEEEDEDDEEESVAPRKRMADNVKTAGSVKASKTEKAGAQKMEADEPIIKMVGYDPKEEEFEEGKPVIAEQPKRKAKNFLIDDDEFEFEFLNMDDK